MDKRLSGPHTECEKASDTGETEQVLFVITARQDVNPEVASGRLTTEFAKKPDRKRREILPTDSRRQVEVTPS